MKPTTQPLSGLSRRAFLERAGLTSAALALPGILAACGDDEAATTTAASPAKAAGFAPSAGSDIPKATVRFGMAPFGDATFYSIGMKSGFYDDVGITVEPKPYGLDVTPDTVVQLLVKDQVDIATINGPGIIRTLSQVPDLKLLGFSDTYIATYLLASPDSKAKPVKDFVSDGMDFKDAIKAAMAQVKGKPAAFNNAGSQRVFLDAIFREYGGLDYKDIDLTVTDDAKIVQLAKGGKIQFGTPDGAAQNVELQRLGWYPLVSVSDLAEGLSEAAPIVAASLSHEGPASKISYYEKNTETVLRFISVMFRIIDYALEDPDKAFALQAPYLKTRSGVDIGVDGIKTIFKGIDPFVKFEDQPQFWGKRAGNSLHYETVYEPQIAAAVKGGILPKGKTFKPSDGIIGKQVYDTLVGLKKQYDALAPKASGLSGDAATLATSAKAQYDARNYLDAYRMLNTAVSG